MAVLRSLALLRVLHTRTTRSAHCAFQWRVVVQMTNLRDGISKGSAAACYTDLRVCFTCVQRLFGPPRHPFQLCFLFFVSFPKFYGSLPKAATTCYYTFLPNIADHKGDATPPHNTAYHIFAQHQLQKFLQGFPPNNKFQLVHEFISCKRKLLNTTVASFCRRTAHKTAEISTVYRFADHGSRPQITANDSQPSRKLARNNTFSIHTVTSVDDPTRETTRKSPPDHLGKCMKPPLAQCATKNYLGRAFPTHAQQGTGTIKQEDHHEHEGKGQRHRIGIYCLLLFSFGGPPPRDDDHSYQDTNDRAAMRFASDTIVNRPWQGRQLFQAAYRGHVRRLNP